MKKVLSSVLLVTILMGASAQTTVTGNITAAGGKIYVNGTNGNINTQGQINVGVNAKTILAADGNIFSQGTINAVNFQTKSGKVYINGTSGNITTTGIINANGNATIDASNGSIWSRGLITTQGGLKVFNGASISGGLDLQNSKITKVANGTDATDAVNKGQLDAETARAIQAENAIKADVSQLKSDLGSLDAKIDQTWENTKGLVASEQERAMKEEARLDSKIDAETQRALSAEKALNEKIDAESSRAKSAEKALDSKIDAETTRAKQAEATLDKRITDESKRLDGKIDAETARAVAEERRIEQKFDVQVNRLDMRIDDLHGKLDREVGRLNTRVDGVLAVVAASTSAAASQVYNPEKRGNISVGAGAYRKAAAITIGASYYTTPNSKVSVNLSHGTGLSKPVVGAGFSIGF